MSLVRQSEQSSIKLASPLLDKARRLGLQLPVDLERLAIARGCDYYQRDLAPRIPLLEEVQLSTTELAIALLVPSLPPTAREIRLAAALLGAPGVCAEDVARLAVQENCADVVRYIALSGQRFEPENPFWASLADLLPDVNLDTKILPHPTRFVEMTGIDRGKIGRFTRWIRPRNRAAA